MLGAVGMAALVAHGIGAAEHFDPQQLELFAQSDVRQRPARAQYGANKWPVSAAEGKPQLDDGPLNGELQQSLLRPAEHYRQRHGAIEWGGLVRLAILPQQLHVHRIAWAKRIIELASCRVVTDGLDSPELG